MKKKRIIAVVAVIAMGVLVMSVGKNARVGNGLSVSGNIEATEVRLSFQVGGKISELLTDEGQNVKKDQIVAKIDAEELLKLRAEVAASLKEAQYNMDTLKKDHERAENLFKAGSISEQKRDAAKTSYDTASSRVDTLKASLDVADLKLGYAELISPMDSVVLVKSAEAGEVVSPGTVIFTIADLKNIWLTGYVNEKDLGRIKLLQPADVTIDTYPGKKYPGKITFISQESEFTPKQIETREERVKRVYRIKISVDNTDMELKPGMPAEARINTGK